MIVYKTVFLLLFHLRTNIRLGQVIDVHHEKSYGLIKTLRNTGVCPPYVECSSDVMIIRPVFNIAWCVYLQFKYSNTIDFVFKLIQIAVANTNIHFKIQLAHSTTFCPKSINASIIIGLHCNFRKTIVDSTTGVYSAVKTYPSVHFGANKTANHCG